MDTDRIVADLHAHTTISDGTMTADELVDVARETGLDWVAITDHDRVHPDVGAPVVERDGVRVVRGIELRVDAGFERLDLLGYGVEHTDALDAEIERLQTDREQRGAAILDTVEDRLGVDLGVEPRPGLGRPHIARAIDESPAPYDYAGAFDRFIGDDGPCYVSREVPSVERGLDLLSDASPVVSLAHPFRYADTEAALDLAADLDAVERYYPYDRPVDEARLDEVIEAHDLLATGGSDAHDRRLGITGLSTTAYARVASRLPDAQG